MSGTTTLGFPTYSGSDAPAGSTQISAVSTAIDAYLRPTPGTITLANSWTNLPSFQAIQFVRIGTLVIISASLNNPSSYSTVQSAVTTGIPTSARPSHEVIVHGAVQSSGTSVQSARVDITPSGGILIYPPAGATIPAGAFHAFTAIYTTNNI